MVTTLTLSTCQLGKFTKAAMFFKHVLKELNAKNSLRREIEIAGHGRCKVTNFDPGNVGKKSKKIASSLISFQPDTSQLHSQGYACLGQS